MIWLQFISKFLRVLREGQTPAQIAGGFALGAMVGIHPGLTLQMMFLWLVIFMLNVNMSAAFLGVSVFALMAYLFDPFFHSLGYLLLVNDVAWLQESYRWMFNAPIAPLTRFYNTVVMGSFATGFLLFLPAYFGIKKFVVFYRESFHQTVEQWKIYQIVSKSKLYNWYVTVRDMVPL